MNRIVGLVALAVAILLAALAISKRNTAPTELEPVAVVEQEAAVAAVPAEDAAVVVAAVEPATPAQEVASEAVDSEEDEDEEAEQQN